MPKKPSIKKESLNKRRDKPIGESEKFISLLKILNCLEQGEYPDARRLAEECEVSTRSIYRYLNLINPIIPITYAPQKKGYTFVNEKARKIIPMSNREIALLASFSDIASQMGEPVKEKFQWMLKRFLIPSMDKAASLFHSPMAGKTPSSAIRFDLITDAVIGQRQLEIEYHAINTGETTSRTVDPYGLVFYDGLWFLYAFCHLRNDFRSFALDRIKEATPLTRTFERKDKFDIGEQLRKSWGIWEGKETAVKVRFTKDVAELIKRKESWHPSEKRKILPTGEVELAFKVLGTDEIKWWLYSWIPNVEIIEPENLREEIKRDLKKASLLYR